MRVEFQGLDADASNYPKPTAPILPVLTARSLLPTNRAKRCRSPFLEPGSVNLQSGRAAIALALRALGAGPGHTVLVPAFHCGSMVEPVLWSGAEVVFYKVQAALGIDLDDVASKLEAHCKAILAPHYFGFPQPLGELNALCARTGTAIIEDCAHAFIDGTGQATLATNSDYAIASTVKFFPGRDGGVLVSRSPRTTHFTAKPPPLRYQAKALVNTLEVAVQYQRFGTFGRMAAGMAGLVQKLRQTPQRATSDTAGSHPEAGNEAAFRWFRAEQVGQRGSFMAYFTPRLGNLDEVARLRRANYQQLLDALRPLPRSAPLHPTLPDGVVPYMFPLLLDAPGHDFPALKQRGVPLWRWEELAISDCPTSQDYRLRLVQIPCHQSLRSAELEWIIDAVKDVLRSEPT